MGNIASGVSTVARASESGMINEPSGSRGETEMENAEEFYDTIDEDTARTKAKEEEMDEFRKELEIKREQRREILTRHRAEKIKMEISLERERKEKLEVIECNRALRELLVKNNIEIPEDASSDMENRAFTNVVTQMKEEFEDLKSNNHKLRCGLADSNRALQSAYSDIADLSAQNTESIKQINALKEVIGVSKTMINLREEQLNALKNKLNEIERSLADREASMLSTDLRQEYERQLQNIRTLRGLYEERARLAEVTRQGLVRDVEEQKLLKEAEINKCNNLTAKVEELETTVENLQETIENKNNEISSCRGETRVIKAEMSVVNKLFSQVLLGYKTKQDLDKLVHRLEENHGLLTQMAERENGSEASSALPKLLLELVSQVDETEEKNHSCELVQAIDKIQDNESSKEELGTSLPDKQGSTSTSAEEIVENLPKVWRVLMELLSHQNTTEETPTEKVTTCYKSVQTKSGPVLVPSVSQTYIRLKDLIIEKLALVKEVNHMKQLNTHLESRLEEQERKLCLVTTELSKTWHVVGRLRRHHHQLHTHEKILKYELQQKRKLLNELKEELEYCREKWEQAREKNSQSERDLRKLRTEFSSRKAKANTSSLNNSAESGYSDERPSDESSESNDESEHIAESFIKSKNKIKTSFETILDSSTDFNLAAEREDPASDMLDVADLPLDAQDSEDHNDEDTPESCINNNLLKNETICIETENSAIVDTESNLEVNSTTNVQVQNRDTNVENKAESAINLKLEISSQPVIIYPAAILKSIAEQNERLAKKDKKLEQLEKNGASLLKQTQETVEISKQIDNTLDHLLNRPTSSKYKDKNFDIAESENLQSSTISLSNTDTVGELTLSVEPSCSSNFKHIILGNIKKCNERVMLNSKKLQNLETASSDVVNNNESNTVSTNDPFIENLRDEDQEFSQKLELDTVFKEESNSSRASSEPSTSSEMDHEARFAARDLRLKRLEEQTKSLVSKVNKTTTKGVKIHYKLEELHNIYGSESSRAGTPSEDNEETTQEENTEPTDKDHSI